MPSRWSASHHGALGADRAPAAHPGFCPAFVAITTDKPSGGTYTLNGIGTTLYGSKDPCSVCGAVTQTHWVTLVFVPVIPLGKCRVKYVQPQRFLSRGPDLMADTGTPA